MKPILELKVIIQVQVVAAAEPVEGIVERLRAAARAEARNDRRNHTDHRRSGAYVGVPRAARAERRQRHRHKRTQHDRRQRQPELTGPFSPGPQTRGRRVPRVTGAVP